MCNVVFFVYMFVKDISICFFATLLICIICLLTFFFWMGVSVIHDFPNPSLPPPPPSKCFVLFVVKNIPLIRVFVFSSSIETPIHGHSSPIQSNLFNGTNRRGNPFFAPLVTFCVCLFIESYNSSKCIKHGMMTCNRANPGCLFLTELPSNIVVGCNQTQQDIF